MPWCLHATHDITHTTPQYELAQQSRFECCETENTDQRCESCFRVKRILGVVVVVSNVCGP